MDGRRHAGARAGLLSQSVRCLRRKDKRAKVLFWDGTGLCLYAKRLEKGRFTVAKAPASGLPQGVRQEPGPAFPVPLAKAPGPRAYGPTSLPQGFRPAPAYPRSGPAAKDGAARGTGPPFPPRQR